MEKSQIERNYTLLNATIADILDVFQPRNLTNIITVEEFENLKNIIYQILDQSNTPLFANKTKEEKMAFLDQILQKNQKPGKKVIVNL